MVIAMYKFYIFRKLYSGCIIHYIAYTLIWHFPKIWQKTRCFEIPTTSKHHLLIGKNKFMVIAMYKFYIFRKLYSGCIIHYIAYTLIWHFPKIWHQTRCFEIPTTFKHHLLIGKNKFVVIAMHKFYIFWKLYSGCIIHFIASTLIWHFPKIWHQTRCFEIPTTSKHHLLIGKNKFMVIAMHKLHIFRKLCSGCIIHFIVSTLNFPKNTTPNKNVLKFLQPPNIICSLIKIILW